MKRRFAKLEGVKTAQSTMSTPRNLLGLVSGWFNDQETSDIKVDLQNDQVVYCHRIFLRSSSPVWAAALQDEKVCSIDFRELDAAIVKICLQFCYTFEIELTDDNLTRVHFFAFQYDLKELQARCEEVMTEKITETNCLSLYAYFLKHEFPSMPKARETVKAFVRNEFAAAALSEDFMHIREEVLCEFLADDMLNAKEDDVLDACCRWLGDSPDPRVRERVLKFVRFPQLSGKKLIEFRSHPLFKPDLEARYNFAMQWTVGRLTVGEDRANISTQLATESKQVGEDLTPRATLLSRSQILDKEMANTLLSMLGGKPLRARLLVNSYCGTHGSFFHSAVKLNPGPVVCIIKSNFGHVFGAYVEDASGEDENWVPGSPKNFLFSLKTLGNQPALKLNSKPGNSIRISQSGLQLKGLTAFGSQHHTIEREILDKFELDPNYKSADTQTLHGEFGAYTPQFMEVFALSPP